MAIYLRKDREKKFSKEEYKELKEFLEQANFNEGKNDYRKGEQYIALNPDKDQIQLKNIKGELLEKIVEILHPNYYQKEGSEEYIIISELFK